MIAVLFLLFVFESEVDICILSKDTVVNLLLKLLRGGIKTVLLELNLRFSHLIIGDDIVVHNLYCQFHVVEGWNVEVELCVFFFRCRNSISLRVRYKIKK